MNPSTLISNETRGHTNEGWENNNDQGCVVCTIYAMQPIKFGETSRERLFNVHGEWLSKVVCFKEEDNP